MAVTEPIPRCATSRRWDIQLLPDGQDLQHWRHEATAVVEAWGFDEPVRATVALGVSELLTNVLRHAGNPNCVLSLSKAGYVVFVQVVDRCPTFPEIKEPNWEDDSGRGLWMLQNMADALRWFAAPRLTGLSGKTVWFRVAGRSEGHR